MKKLFYTVALSFLLGACSTSSQMGSSQMGSSQSSNPSTVIGVNQKTFQEKERQIAEKSDWTTPLPSNVGMGIGPVNIAASNFYFEGNLQIIDNMPTFYDCAAGVNLPIATDQGIYSEVSKQYGSAVTEPGGVMRGKFRGYLVDNPGAPYPKKLVITYIVGWQKDAAMCDQQKVLTGKWNAQLAAAYNGNIVLTLTNDFSFSATISSAKGNSEVKGSWMLTSDTDIVFFYTTINPYMGHSGSYNPKNMTMFVPTSSGTLILKK
ncbi:MAG: hypothetical protein RR202_12465 [Bacteroidales bacterium]